MICIRCGQSGDLTKHYVTLGTFKGFICDAGPYAFEKLVHEYFTGKPWR